jgi:hypothetical protein
MHRRNILNLSAITAFGLVLLSNGSALAQTKSLKDQIVGAWTLVSTINTGADGSKFDPWGTDGKGTIMYDANGNFAFKGSLTPYVRQSAGAPDKGDRHPSRSARSAAKDWSPLAMAARPRAGGQRTHLMRCPQCV